MYKKSKTSYKFKVRCFLLNIVIYTAIVTPLDTTNYACIIKPVLSLIHAYKIKHAPFINK